MVQSCSEDKVARSKRRRRRTATERHMCFGFGEDVVPVQHPALGRRVDVFAAVSYVMHAAILRDDRDPGPIGRPRVRLHLHRFTRQEAVQVVVCVVFLLPPAGVLVVDLLAVSGQ
ncbi:hypothetical protein INR49_013482 [Caranx melampygus]|nr:hypothetical protein INR49_013482 [Caranx melampygus]